MNKRIMIIAGEPSGDLHGSNLTRALKELSPEVELCGIGGKRMKEAGVEIFCDIVDLAIVGFVEVLKNLKRFKEVFNLLVKQLDSQPPNVVILIDYPGFNLRFAREVKKRGLPIIYYISPQVWAWGRGRIKLIKNLVDKLIVIFKFEQDLYRTNGIDASFVGHPLLDIVRSKFSKDEFKQRLGLSNEKLTVGILPGSREKEVEKLLPIMLRACKIIYKELKTTQFLILKSPTIKKKIFDNWVGSSHFPLRVVENESYDYLNVIDLALVASGTATLETAILEKPMLIIYKVSLLNWLLLRPQIRIPYIGLVNVVAGKRVVPEFLQYEAKPKKIAKEALSLLRSPERQARMKDELAKVKESLGAEGASQRAAQIILDRLMT